MTVIAFDNGFDDRGARKYLAAVKLGARYVFTRFDIYGAFSPRWSGDSDQAKAHVLTHIAMKPGDTDAEFFKDYLPQQLEFVERFGDEISMISLERYGEQ